MADTKQTSCPSCGVDIDVNELLYAQLDTELNSKYQEKLQAERQQLKSKAESINIEKAQLEETIANKVSETVHAERTKLKKSLQQEQSQRIEAMQSELADKSAKVVELNKAQFEVERLKREQSELRSQIELQMQKKFGEQLSAQNDKIRSELQNESAFKVAEKETVINQLKKQLIDAQRQAEQGSQQIQGEVQELAIEAWLGQQFPFDTIKEVKKGAIGADTLQTINTQQRSECGSIYYESKRTKAFQPSWIAKFKTDIQTQGANIGVLVTQVMPEGMGALGQIDGVWICTFEEFKNLAHVLRESIIQLDQALVVQENKGDKMGMLYDFLTGNEFRMQIEAIVEGFTQLKTDLESEKRSMQSIWKKREKQIERVLLNTNFMYSSVKGIAGNAVQSVALLELDGENNKNSDEVN